MRQKLARLTAMLSISKAQVLADPERYLDEADRRLCAAHIAIDSALAALDGTDTPPTLVHDDSAIIIGESIQREAMSRNAKAAMLLEAALDTLWDQ